MSGWEELEAPAKINLALVVGPLRPEGKHEIATVLERVTLADTVAVRRANETRVTGFDGDTIVRDALDRLARVAEGEPRFEARIEKRIPVAAGLGGGSSDAAAALRLANRLLAAPLPHSSLDAIAASLGADVPFFLRSGTQLGTADGTSLEPLTLPRDYTIVLALPHGSSKSSTGTVYAEFDTRNGGHGFEARKEQLRASLARVVGANGLASLPRNDLASSPLEDDLRALGAFRAGVTGAGPTVYGLFGSREDAEGAAVALRGVAVTWITQPG